MKEIIIVAGANGSGKTTLTIEILEQIHYTFLNADEIEKDLSVSKLEAGKEFLKRLNNLIFKGESFILESTLAGNYLIKVIEDAKKAGYIIKIVYVFLESYQDCIQRIKIRVKTGGHFVPNEDVIRRYYRSKANFWNIYKNLADEWTIMYNSTDEEPLRVAIGVGNNFVIELEHLFEKFLKDLEQ